MMNMMPWSWAKGGGWSSGGAVMRMKLVWGRDDDDPERLQGRTMNWRGAVVMMMVIIEVQ